MTIAFVAMMAFVAAQTPPAAPVDTRKWKDEKETALGTAAASEKDPTAQLEKLDKWKQAFPDSDYDVARTGAYVAAYGQLKRYHDQIVVVQESRKKYPDNLDLLRAVLEAFRQTKTPGAEDIAAANEVAHYIVDHADQVFSPDKAKLTGNTDDAWKALKPKMVEYANAQIDTIAENQGPDAVLELLKKEPSRVQLNQWLGQQYVPQGSKDPSKIVLALFHYARVSEYDGPNAAPAATRAAAKRYFDKQYAGYHGSPDGADQVLASAKANSVPPAGFDIESITKISEKKIKENEEKRKANPMITLWADTRMALTGDGGPAYFDQIKDALMPGAAIPGVTKFKAKIVSMTPPLRPKNLVLALEKDGVADCTLVLETPLAGKMDVGSEIEFEGTVKEFTKDPYMLTFAVEKDNIVGWTGKNAPGVPTGAIKKTAKKTTP